MNLTRGTLATSMQSAIALSGYQLTEQLYAGSRTLVYRALREIDHRPVVIKLLKNEHPSFSELVQFRNQYAITIHLEIPGIIQPYGLEPYHNGYALVMEDVGGTSLREWMKQRLKGTWGTREARGAEEARRAEEAREDGEERGVGGIGENGEIGEGMFSPSAASASPDSLAASAPSASPAPLDPSAIPLTQFFSIALQLVDTLHQLHQQRIIHKDIKPANILIQPETLQVKLIDFSIASLLPRETQEIQNPRVLEGTLAYLSPEQTGRMNRGIDYRSDFYSLGITFFELLTGQLPFQLTDPMEMVHCHLAKQPLSACDLNPDIPLMLGEIIRKLMAKNAEDRYQSATGLKYDLVQCQEEWHATGTHTWFKLGQRDVSDRFLIPEKLYGREQEVQTLLEAFGQVANGATELILVAGFSGIGKTAAVNEVHKPIVRWNGYFIKGKYDQFQRNIPLSAFVQAFRDLMGQLLSESDTQLADWKVKILSAVGDNGQVLIDVIPELECILGKQPAAPALSGSAAQNRFKLLFQKFIAVFATLEHPLVLFLDDLQWADAASLNLMQVLLSQVDTGYLMLIGAYRDNEVFPTHPLMLTIADLQKANATINTLTLAPLSQSSLNALVADTLHCDIATAQPLTDLVYQKTQGNPFFATQFLKTLHEDGWIVYDAQAGHWQCDLVAVRSLSLTDDVVEFMALQLQKLPSVAQTMLQLAACIGAQFDLHTLAIVFEQTTAGVALALWQALQDGFLLPINEVYKFYQPSTLKAQASSLETFNCSYRFLHDRVQQAAYSLIADDQKQSTHLRIGRLLQHATAEHDQKELLFTIVNHFNQGAPLIEDKQEQQELVQLNLAAGQKAKSATAYGAALNYFNTGIALLQDDRWQSQYDLTLALYEGTAESAYLNGDFEQMKPFMLTILEQARTLLDTVKVYELQIQAALAQNQPLEAVQIALKFLKLLDINFPEHPTEQDSAQALATTATLLAGRKPLDLMALPQMHDASKLAALRILVEVTPCAYISAPALVPLLILEQVTLSIQAGNAPSSAFGYACYGLLLCGIVGEIDTGHQFGQLALHLFDQFDVKELKARTHGQVYVTVWHWKEPVRSTLIPLREAYQSGLDTGDLAWASIAACLYVVHAYLGGTALNDLSGEFAVLNTQLAQIKQEAVLNQLKIFQQSLLNLLNSGEQPQELTGDVFNAEQMLPVLEQSNDRIALFYFYTAKLFLSYLFGDLESAIAAAIANEAYIGAATGLFVVPFFYTYDALAHLAFYDQLAEAAQRNVLERVAAIQKKLKTWADHAPMNHLHKFYLVEAERCRVLGQKAEAIDLYDRAIAAATENEYVQEAAIANELATKFYLEWGKERLAQDYLMEAYYGYARWGAKAKIVNLETRYPTLLAPILQQTRTAVLVNETVFATGTATSTSSSSISDSLDLAAILQASQILSSEIELDKLLSALLHTVIQMAGANKCVLMLLEEECLLIKATAALTLSNQLEIHVQPSPLPVQDSCDVPVSLVNIVKYSLKPIVIANAKVHPQFAIDSYIQTQQPKSLLCSPILLQGKLLGMVYLENSLATGVFTDDRLELLNLLCAQAAISLENARLYGRSQQNAQQLEQKTSALEQALIDLQNAQLQIVQSEKMSALGNLVAGVAHEINNPVGFISGNLQPALAHVQDTFRLLDLYQQEYPHASATIQDEIDAVDLDYVREDLPKLIGSMQLGIDRIRSISASLRTFSRADKDYKVPFNIHEGIDSTILILKHRLKANESRPEIEVVTHYGSIPMIKCFPGQLNQVFMNILANAIDAIEEANQPRSFAEIQTSPNRIAIQTRLNDSDDHVVIRIHDNGVGMTDVVKQRVFDHLFTTKAVGKGTGLGLAIARQIVVEKHGGCLDIHSAPGEGALFIITLPVKEQC